MTEIYQTSESIEKTDFVKPSLSAYNDQVNISFLAQYKK